ncbi:uncharacterized protein LOC127285790 [Leptopilina boulardi]|uniref:uncharacterized protein LOC127285790 n=1 Tax=Leptopilina boulardi TaxID=63433 RepID=UPI0021F683E7|nr:uncharacterized protein LOC127285790 [Leptopilina boulardi]
MQRNFNDNMNRNKPWSDLYSNRGDDRRDRSHMYETNDLHRQEDVHVLNLRIEILENEVKRLKELFFNQGSYPNHFASSRENQIDSSFDWSRLARYEMTLPTFAGELSDDPQEYLRDIDQYLLFKKVPFEYAPKIIQNSLKGHARTWFDANKYDIMNFNQFCDRFREEFLSLDVQERRRDRWRSLKYYPNQETLVNFFYNQRSEGMRIQPPMSNYEINRIIISQLPSNVQVALAGSDLSNVKQVVHSLTRIDDANANTGQRNFDKSSNRDDRSARGSSQFSSVTSSAYRAPPEPRPAENKAQTESANRYENQSKGSTWRNNSQNSNNRGGNMPSRNQTNGNRNYDNSNRYPPKANSGGTRPNNVAAVDTREELDSSGSLENLRNLACNVGAINSGIDDVPTNEDGNYGDEYSQDVGDLSTNNENSRMSGNDRVARED